MELFYDFTPYFLSETDQNLTPKTNNFPFFSNGKISKEELVFVCQNQSNLTDCQEVLNMTCMDLLK